MSKQPSKQRENGLELTQEHDEQILYNDLWLVKIHVATESQLGVEKEVFDLGVFSNRAGVFKS